MSQNPNIETERFDFPGNYRAIVEENDDPNDIGRVRVRIIGIHSLDPAVTPTSNLPWAEPCLSLYYSGGQNLTNKSSSQGQRYSPDGVTFTPPSRTTETYTPTFQDSIMKSEGSGGFYTVPRKGTLVWIFFDVANHMRPQYWAAAPKKADWLAQRKKITTEVANKQSEISDIRGMFTPDTSTHKGSGPSAGAAVATKVSKPRLQISPLDNVKNSQISSFTSPGGVTYIIVNEDGNEKTYIIHKGYMEYTDQNGQRKVLVGKTEGKANDLEQTIANNFELHIGGDFDTYVHKSHFIQVDGDAKVLVKGNVGVYAGKDMDLIADGSINMNAKGKINMNADGGFQFNTAGSALVKVAGDYSTGIGGNHSVSVGASLEIAATDMHLKATTNQVFEAALQQTMLSNIFIGKANSMYSINSDAITRINAGAAIQNTAATIDLGGTAVNVGGVVMLGSAAAQPAPQVQPPSTDGTQIVSKKKFEPSTTPKTPVENPPAA
jgi:hypothetical protein